jgi:hypothetical protein
VLTVQAELYLLRGHICTCCYAGLLFPSVILVLFRFFVLGFFVNSILYCTWRISI